jgi:hypothetical protein
MSAMALPFRRFCPLTLNAAPLFAHLFPRRGAGFYNPTLLFANSCNSEILFEVDKWKSSSFLA